MDNQHKKIKGYRDLSQEEIDLMNEVKHQGALLEKMVAKLDNLQTTDTVWLQQAEMLLKQGIMAAVRSIAKPDSF
jgi:hypothetical protein